MLVPDLTFNLLLAVVDVAAVAFLLIQRHRSDFLTRLIAVGALYLSLACLLSVGLAEAFHFRVFAVFRFLGHTGVFHVPLLLLLASALGPKRHAWRWGALGLAITMLGGAVYAYRVEPYRLETTHFAWTSSRLEGLTRPVRILQVADIQTDRFGPFESRVAEAMRRLEPDMILFLGDYIQTRDAVAYERLSAEFQAWLRSAGVNPPLGSFAVQGDCEKTPAWTRLFDGTGVTVLSDETRVIALPGCEINLIALGVESSRTSRPELLQRAGLGRVPDRLDLYIGHSPDFADQLLAAGQPFLAMAGHTHGGQVQLPLLGPLITYSRLPRAMADAFAPFGAGVLSVSRGLGMERIEAPRVRFLCRPELRLVTLLPPDGPTEGERDPIQPQASGPEPDGWTRLRSALANPALATPGGRR